MTQVKNNTESNKGKHLTYEEMVKIEGYKENNLSNRKIGRLLKRDKQTINNAIHAGKVTQKRLLVRHSLGLALIQKSSLY